MSIESEITRALIEAGTGALIALVLLVGLYRLMRGLGEKFIDAQRRQAEALGAQAQSVAGLTASIQGFMSNDNTEHREMLVLLRFIAQRQNEFEEVRREHIRCKTQAHQGCASGPSQD